jgi:hypothetical protein
MRRAFPLAVGVAASLLLAASAAATIVPQKGIAGVRIGMNPPRVRLVLGNPLRADHVKNEFGAATVWRYRRLQVTFQGDRSVTAVSTTRRSERTASGVGVGSSEAQLKAGVKGLTCKTESGVRYCYLGKFLAGHRVTDFFLKRGKVSRVAIGVVID